MQLAWPCPHSLEQVHRHRHCHRTRWMEQVGDLRWLVGRRGRQRDCPAF